MLLEVIANLVFWVGFVRFMLILHSFVKFTKTHFTAPLDLKSRYGENSWAVITGGAKGIGRSNALYLAKHGFNIFIWDTDKTALEAIQDEIRLVNSDIKVIQVYKDLANGQEISFYKKLYDEAKDLDVSILVNNVGIITYDTYDKTPIAKVAKMIKLNVIMPALLTSLFINKLKSRAKRSALIITSSCVGFVPSPPMSIYTATKGFSRFLGQGLAEEFRGQIDVLTT